MASGMVDPRIFEQLQTRIDEDAEVREQIRAITQTLERQGRNAQSILSRAHSTPAAHREYRYFSLAEERYQAGEFMSKQSMDG